MSCTFFSSNFTPRRGDTQLVSQMVARLCPPSFSLWAACRPLSPPTPTSWPPGLPSSLCSGAPPPIKTHSQLPTHTSQVSWKECGGSWSWITRQKTPRTRSQVRKRLPERRSLSRLEGRRLSEETSTGVTQPAVLWDAVCTA